MANHSLYRGCYTVTNSPKIELDISLAVEFKSLKLDALSILEERTHEAFSKWEERLAVDRSSWGMVGSSLSAGRWGGERLLHSERKFFQFSAQFLINFKLTMNGRRTNTGCDSWTLPAGIFGAPRTPEGNVNVNRVKLCGVMSVRSFKDNKPLGLEY